MSKKILNYDIMVEEASRGVVIKALQHAAIHGLPDEHQFYITFKTNRSDVDIPVFLKEQYPDEMAIILEHQFWDLKIHERDFEVALSFNDKRERLLIPFNAITAFSDPSVNFELEFQEIETRDSVRIIKNEISEPYVGETGTTPEESTKERFDGNSTTETARAEKNGTTIFASVLKVAGFLLMLVVISVVIKVIFIGGRELGF